MKRQERKGILGRGKNPNQSFIMTSTVLVILGLIHEGENKQGKALGGPRRIIKRGGKGVKATRNKVTSWTRVGENDRIRFWFVEKGMVQNGGQHSKGKRTAWQMVKKGVNAKARESISKEHVS